MVEPTQQTPTFAQLSQQSGSKSFFNADSKPGDTITGTITKVDVTQAKDYQTGEPQFSKTGKAKYVVRIDLINTNAPRTNEFDDGSRSIYINWWGEQLNALQRALHAVSPTYQEPKEGDTMTATYTGLGTPFARGLSAPKLYEYKFEQAKTSAFAQLNNPFTPATANTQATQQPPTQPAQPAQAQQTTMPANTGTGSLPAETIQKIRQLGALGIDMAEIARITGTTTNQVATILPDNEPEF